MSLATLLDLLSSLLGLFGGAFFCIGVLHLKQSSVEAIAFSMWQKGITIATELVSQKFDFVAGAILLFISFSLQFPVKIWPGAFSQTVATSQEYGVGIGLSISVVCASVLRFLTYRACKKALSKLQKKREEQEQAARACGS